MGLSKLVNESTEEYIQRLINNKNELGITWQQLADTVYDEVGIDHSEKWYRTRSVCNNSQPQMDIDDITRLKIERAKLSDAIVQNNTYIRRIAREETLKEIAKDVCKEMNSNKILDDTVHEIVKRDNAIGTLVLSDWHYGIEVDNAWNTFNPEIAIERINQLKYEVINDIKLFGIKQLNVVNLSDLICGRIHYQLRLQSRYDVITQVMHVSEIMAELINDLGAYVNIEYYDCSDNHSRIEPNKKESLATESFARITHWYLINRDFGDKHIHINENRWGDDIITFNIFDYKVAAVHGDKDAPNKVVSNLTLMTREHYDLILTAHRHHFFSEEENETLSISNPSLMGTDTYAADLRCSAIPAQNLIISTPYNVARYISKINLI